MYTVFFKCRMLSLLYSLLYTYSFFIAQGTDLLSHVYFIPFLLAVSLRCLWSDCFLKDMDILRPIKYKAMLDSPTDLYSFTYSMSFNIFMFLDQSTFPFNGCKGRKRI
jgi:hypothetical protein